MLHRKSTFTIHRHTTVSEIWSSALPFFFPQGNPILSGRWGTPAFNFNLKPLPIFLFICPFLFHNPSMSTLLARALYFSLYYWILFISFFLSFPFSSFVFSFYSYLSFPAFTNSLFIERLSNFICNPLLTGSKPKVFEQVSRREWKKQSKEKILLSTNRKISRRKRRSSL